LKHAPLLPHLLGHLLLYPLHLCRQPLLHLLDLICERRVNRFTEIHPPLEFVVLILLLAIS